MKGINKAIQASRVVAYTPGMYYNLMYNPQTNEVWCDKYVGGDSWKDYGNKDIVCLRRGQLKLTREVITKLVIRYKQERA